MHHARLPPTHLTAPHPLGCQAQRAEAASEAEQARAAELVACQRALREEVSSINAQQAERKRQQQESEAEEDRRIAAYLRAKERLEQASGRGALRWR